MAAAPLLEKMIDAPLPLISLLGPWYSSGALNKEEFDQLCAAHPELLIEQEPDGKVALMAPLHLNSGYYEMEVGSELRNYARLHQLGQGFSSSTGFRLPDGSLRSPDASFVSHAQLSKLLPAERKQYATIVPEFIVEIRSDSDHLPTLKRKMQESWIANGVKLAWLIDPLEEKTYIYRADGSVAIRHGFDQILSGEQVLPGFEFDLKLLQA